ncbi:hypothetical protein BMT54_04070 [Pasteurellaceae bacterium 15-036681]|nr:hypothetical protein BMT54_04070 [Pasteurellaceae bacterium 15-036681]
MNQNNTRKEPTFGEPSKATDITENIGSREQIAAQKGKLSFSVHSNQNPGYTFTPPLTRPAEFAKDVETMTMEEQALLKANKQTMTVEPEMVNEKQDLKPQTSGFAFSPVVEESNPKPAEVESTVKIEKEKTMNTENNKAEVPPVVPPMNTNNVERVIPTPNQSSAPVKSSPVDRVPAKYRRLLLVLLLALALLLVFFLLKPKTPETVEQLQEQGTSLPIEFRPVDEAEAKRAEEEAKAHQEALAQEQAAKAQSEQPAIQSENLATTPVTAPTAEVAQASSVQASPAQAPAVVAQKPIVVEPIKKPETSGSVIYQPETAKKAEPKKVERLAPANQTAATKPALVKAEPVKVEKAQPVKATATQTTAVTTAATAPVAASSKTMTVPKGVSLMQVFRDNNLNIADVNAMSKVNNVVSNLKVGEKVTVRLDNNNRVVEMRIGSGGKFTRQANGSYTFSR